MGSLLIIICDVAFGIYVFGSWPKSTIVALSKLQPSIDKCGSQSCTCRYSVQHMYVRFVCDWVENETRSWDSGNF